MVRVHKSQGQKSWYINIESKDVSPGKYINSKDIGPGKYI